MRCRLTILLFFLWWCRLTAVEAFTRPTTTSETASSFATTSTAAFPHKVVVTVPLNTIRPPPKDSWETFDRLWNDKRSLADLWRDSALAGSTKNDLDNNQDSDIPYCLVSDKFTVAATTSSPANLTFQVLLYPRGVYSSRPTGLTDQTPASAYLSFCGSSNSNDEKEQAFPTEADVAWKLQLVNRRTNQALPVVTSGGLPRSKTTWSAAMTFCTLAEAVDSLGRTADWGSSTWKAADVCDGLGHLDAQVELTIFATRTKSTSWQWPPRGALGAVARAVTQGHPNSGNVWTAGQVVVAVPRNATEQRQLAQEYGIYAGVDYRIMTLRDKDATEIFTTKSSPEASLALRPVGWKVQAQMWRQRGWHTWPVEVPLTQLAPILYSRLHPRATVPRLAAFAKDLRAVVFALTVALAPLATALVGRQFVTLTAIPSGSMDPVLRKGDVLLVEKLPDVYSRMHRGDIVLFRPPTTLQETIRQAGGKVSPNQLFVKRLVGIPGDEDIVWQRDSKQLTIGGQPAVGPPRNLCDDEPLRLIDSFLQKGQGTEISLLGPDETYVLGDCQAVSIDSRVFGSLPKENIVGRPVARIWPLDRFRLGSP